MSVRGHVKPSLLATIRLGSLVYRSNAERWEFARLIERDYRPALVSPTLFRLWVVTVLRRLAQRQSA